MLKKIAIIASSIIASYSANAAEQSEGTEKQLTRFCSGSPALPTDKEMNNNFKTQITTIIQYCFECTPEKNQPEVELMRQNAWSNALSLADILYPIGSSDSVTFNQLSKKQQEHREYRVDKDKALINELMKINNIQQQCSYLSAYLDGIRWGIKFASNIHKNES